MSVEQWVRPGIQAMKGYTPGEQPRGLPRLVKLNTNENPYGAPDVVLDAVRQAVGDTLRKYPEPTAAPVREAAARAFKLNPDQVLVGNGSDDILTIILRTFVEPGRVVIAPDPTYSLYKPLTDIQGGLFQTTPWNPDGSLPTDALLAANPAVIFVVRPNAPTGHIIPLEAVADLCQKAPGIVVLDEAYGDFCADNGLQLLPHHPNLIVTRSFSKSFSLAGLRIGLGFGSTELLHQMNKVRDSYNVDGLAQAAASAALDNLDAFADNTRRILEQRTRLTNALNQRGFTVPDSHANFVLAQIPDGRRDGQSWFQDLRAEGIIVRYFGKHPALVDKLRISIGTESEMTTCLEIIDSLLKDN